MAKDPTTVAKAWADAMGSVQTQNKIKAGIQSPKRSPTQTAAASADTWQAKVSSSAAKAKFVASLSRVTDAQWQQATLTKGLPRIAAGAQAAQPKMQAFLSQWLPFVANVQQQIQSMPKVTLQDSINRMVANVQALSQFKRT